VSEFSSAQDFLEAAAERCDLNDFGSDDFRTPLEAWIDDLAHPRLNDPAREHLTREVGRDLVKRLRIVDTLKRRPEIDQLELPPIVLIAGCARTGTTLLHNLLAQHPRARAVLRWELDEPVPPPTAESYATDPRAERAKARMDGLRDSPLAAMHWVGGTDPEECARGYYDCTGMMLRACTIAMPTWGELVWRPDRAESTFREYRRLLQLLTVDNPLPPGGHLVLKCPQIGAMTREFREVFPEAKVVLTHRDPFRVATSAARVIDTINAPMLADPRSVGDDNGSVLRPLRQQMRAMVQATREQPDHAVNVHYASLMDDAVETVDQIHRALGIEWPRDELEAAVRGYLRAQRAGTRPKPPSELADRGFDRETLYTDAAVADYVEHFAVPSELSRRSDPATPS
jgi:hypothetical protein